MLVSFYKQVNRPGFYATVSSPTQNAIRDPQPGLAGVTFLIEPCKTSSDVGIFPSVTKYLISTLSREGKFFFLAQPLENACLNSSVESRID
jgi:hypothetical protein